MMVAAWASPYRVFDFRHRGVQADGAFPGTSRARQRVQYLQWKSFPVALRWSVTEVATNARRGW
mgnify:CR=1 FL=1